VAQTTGRALDAERPLLATPPAPGPGVPTAVERAPVLGERPQARATYRYRARFTKSGRMRFLGHLDLSRLLLRTLRRSGIELVYSEGFNPKPRVGFGPALAVGIASDAEYLDFDSYDRVEGSELGQRIRSCAPPGVEFDLVREIHPRCPALGEAIQAARYRVVANDGRGFGELALPGAERPARPVRRETKKGRIVEFDLASEVIELGAVDERTLRMTLAVRTDGASLRPDEALGAIFGERARELELIREELLVPWRGRWVNPILAAAASPGASADVQRDLPR
jgi:radical SAM-linked protein